MSGRRIFAQVADVTRRVQPAREVTNLRASGENGAQAVFSSSAYEAAPERMVRLLHEEPARLLAAEADDLLEGLFRDVPEAGGAVVTRLG